MLSPSHFGVHRARGGAFRWPASPASERDAYAHFLRIHLWWPLFAFSAALWWVDAAGVDWRLAHALYAWEGYRWLLKHWFFTETLIHRIGRGASIAAWLGVVAAWAIARRRESWSRWTSPLAYLALSVLLSTLMIAWVKSWSNIDCPWDLAGLGGARPYFAMFEPRPTSLPQGICFPAGHASGGYAWMALYFFLRMAGSRWRRWGLFAGIALGLIFGLGQQLRGAHFFSHDVWTAAICWFIALGVYGVFQDRLMRSAQQRRWDAIGD
jgi:membrane-associated PAP2 superfamily phosphatase